MDAWAEIAVIVVFWATILGVYGVLVDILGELRDSKPKP